MPLNVGPGDCEDRTAFGLEADEGRGRGERVEVLVEEGGLGWLGVLSRGSEGGE